MFLVWKYQERKVTTRAGIKRSSEEKERGKKKKRIEKDFPSLAGLALVKDNMQVRQ